MQESSQKSMQWNWPKGWLDWRFARKEWQLPKKNAIVEKEWWKSHDKRRAISLNRCLSREWKTDLLDWRDEGRHGLWETEREQVDVFLVCIKRRRFPDFWNFLRKN